MYSLIDDDDIFEEISLSVVYGLNAGTTLISISFIPFYFLISFILFPPGIVSSETAKQSN